MREQTLTISEDLALFVRRWGSPSEKIPVLCLHGLTRSSLDFTVIGEDLAKATDREVIALDVRGRGQSSFANDPMSYQIPTYVGDVIAALDHLSIPRVIGLSTSMGGLIFMGLGAARPDILSALILNDVGPELDPRGLLRILSYTGASSTPADWDGAADYAKTINEVAFPHYGADDWMRFARRIFKETTDGPRLNYDPKIMVPFQTPPTEPVDLKPLFQMVATGRPTLAIRGEISDLLSEEGLDLMKALAPDLETLTVPGVGHAPMLDEAEAFAGLVAFVQPQA